MMPLFSSQCLPGRRRVALLLALAVGAARASLGIAGEHQAAPWMLLLANGNVVAGDVTQDRDYYHVRQPHQVIHIRRGEVAAVAQSLVELYVAQRKVISDTDVGGHLQLADWCLRYKLYSIAADELRIVRQIDPTHPRLELSETRFRVAMRRLEDRQRPREGVVTAAYEAEVPTMIVPIPGDLNRPGERPIISDEAMESFARTVQPLLLNSCTTSGCHSRRGGDALRLARGGRTRGVDRQTTLRNLEEILRWIDSGEPLASPLLHAATTPHGGARIAPLAEQGSSHRDTLVDWLNLVAESPAPDDVRPAAARAEVVDRGVGTTTAGLGRRRTGPGIDEFDFDVENRLFPPGKVRRGLRVVGRPDRSRARDRDAIDSAPPGERDASSDDPFDPEQFNQLPNGRSELESDPMADASAG